MKKITLLLLLSFVACSITAQDYVVESIGFNPPHSYIQANANTNSDDLYSGIIPIGFDFEFYGNTYNDVVIGGNGIINFDTTLAGGFCPWTFDQDLPSTTMETNNAIFGAYHDMDSSVSSTDEVNYAQYGTAPNRRFVVNFYLVPHFQCNDIISTFQIVMYETTNNIDVYIKDKPICGTWNNGNTLIGIQNIDGTEGIAAPGRNTSDSPWEAYNEAWRFSFFEGETVEAYNTTFSVCDTGNGGFESFDFSLIEGDVAGNQSNVTVSFHETFLDANNNINPIASPYVNILNPQTVYARVENSDGLFATSEVTLEVIDCIDNDNDGVSTEQEDLNGDGYPGNDDTDNDGIPNYLDEDDDNDNVDTIDEITGIGAGFNGVTYIFIDTDSDGIENYIDNDDDGDGVLSVFEDYNGNGTPIDDDTNANNIPDFLDDEVAIILVIESNSTVDFSISPNPASEMIQIQLSNFSSETQVILYNIQGQVVLSEIKNSENGNFAINVSDLALGMYFVQLQSEDKTVSKKLIKN
ncbi:T9SS type A sorting domain-containing protein [Candidatus Marifrigoribacter sp. Uisw_064]|uniref:T9SS type A sorting domain-containing protein n=1 Tax=Candidatus Marifrigoribacter sp. Uisw_064 TaxID=3230970 RepID=UPI003D3A324C